jgi:peptide/nickel transport system ATP-binding protein
VNAPLLSVRNLKIGFRTGRGLAPAVEDVSFDLQPGETLGVVGESGSGKSVTNLAILRLVPSPGEIAGGEILFEGRAVLKLPDRELRALRGGRIAMVFQDPMSSLHPLLRISTQMMELTELHLGLSRQEARRYALLMLEKAGMADAARVADGYPHQLSGGMRQRVMIAMALSSKPKLLIADEPTTALDVTIQAQILDLLAREQRRRHMAMILITHDLGVVAGRTDEVAVMYAGRVVERAPTPALFKKMRMPYTEALLAAIPKLDAPPHTVLPAISGRPPDPTRPIKGCSFSPRCRYAVARCHGEKPELSEAETPAHQYACFHPIEMPVAVPA